MAFISGGFTGSPMLGSAGKLTINHWAFHSITTLMTGGTTAEILGSLAVLFITALVLWSLGLVLYNRRVTHE